MGAWKEVSPSRSTQSWQPWLPWPARLQRGDAMDPVRQTPGSAPDRVGPGCRFREASTKLRIAAPRRFAVGDVVASVTLNSGRRSDCTEARVLPVPTVPSLD